MVEILSLSICERAALVLAFPLLIWFILGRCIMWGASLAPFVLRKVFQLFYELVETLVAYVHGRMGADFYKTSNMLSAGGKKVNTKLSNWYQAWHRPKKAYRGIAVFIYLLCVVLIGIPSLFGTNIHFLGFCQSRYLLCEEVLVGWFEEQGWYESEADVVMNNGEFVETEDTINAEYSEIILNVSGVKSALLIRNSPSIDAEEKLGRLYNGDQVIWNGQLTFSKGENDKVEPWVKIVTSDGIEGWSRMLYLLPEEYENIMFHVKKQEN
ncbi:SH3 domain-containing protein [Candidatus Merdisoma sp. JLR.KK006]|uniref:SH3 domain-containing protein n=1 Tax=Candidatus Merdisoma sp. JLR.KK006 TaxID=3112626 RepID=UPI002FEEFB43